MPMISDTVGITSIQGRTSKAPTLGLPAIARVHRCKVACSHTLVNHGPNSRGVHTQANDVHICT